MQGQTQRRTFHSSHVLIGVGILALAFAFNAWRLTDVPPGLDRDAAANGLMALKWLRDGVFPFWMSHASAPEPIIVWLQTLSTAIFGPSVFALRIVSVALISLSAMTVYFLTLEVGRGLPIGFGSLAAMFAGLAAAVNPVMSELARTGLRATSLPLMSGLFFLALLAIQWLEYDYLKPAFPEDTVSARALDDGLDEDEDLAEEDFEDEEEEEDLDAEEPDEEAEGENVEEPEEGEEGLREATDERAASKGDAVAVDHPDQRDDADGVEDVRQNRQHVLRADEAAVEQREAGNGHQQHEHGGDEHPRVVALVDDGLGRRLRERWLDEQCRGCQRAKRQQTRTEKLVDCHGC